AAAGEFRQLAAQIDHVGAGFDNRLADLRAELDHRLVHLWFDLLFEHDLPAFENLLNVRTQLARLWIDNRKLLLDAESEGVIFHSYHRDGVRACTEQSRSEPSIRFSSHAR